MNCEKYKKTLSRLVSIIQGQTRTIETLQSELRFKDELYQEQNKLLTRTQEHFLCCNCLWHFQQPNHDFELCEECSTTLPQ